MKDILSIVIALNLIFSASAFAQAPTADIEKIDAALSIAEKDAAKLLISSAVLTSQLGEVVEIDEKIQARYETAALSVGYSVPGAVVAGGLTFTTVKFFEKVKFIFKPLTWLFQTIWLYAVKPVVNFADWLSTKLKIDQAVEWSSEGVEKSVKAVVNLIQTVIPAGAYWASGISAFGTSSFVSVRLVFYDIEENLTVDRVRSLLGQDDAMKRKLKNAVAESAQIFNLTPAKQDVLVELLIKDLTVQAVEKGFQKEATYDLNIAKVIIENELVNSEVALAYNGLVAAFDTMNTKPTEQEVTQVEKLAEKVAVIAGIAAVLESQSLNGNLTEKQQKEVDHLVGNANRSLQKLKEVLTL